MFRKQGRIFISYRREDEPASARNIRDRLARKFGKSEIFMDVDNLFAGQRFDLELEKALTQCEVLIAVIGTRWTSLLAEHRRRGERDYVQDEIAAALRRKIRVVPVVVGREGRMPRLPHRKDLPEDIRDLVLYQKVNLVHESFSDDIGKLIAAVDFGRASELSVPRWQKAAVAALIVSVAATAALAYSLDLLPYFSRRPAIASSPTVQPGTLPDTLLPGLAKAPANAPASESDQLKFDLSSHPPPIAPPGSLPGAARPYFVQVTALRTESAARAEFEALKIKHPQFLGSWQPTISRAELKDSGVWYRAAIGPMTEYDARALCSRFKDGNLSCVPLVQ